MTEKNANEKLIAPVDNLKGKPIYIYSGEFDESILPWAQDLEEKVFQHFGADVHKFMEPNKGHKMRWHMPWMMMQYLYEKIPSSGVTSEKPL